MDEVTLGKLVDDLIACVAVSVEHPSASLTGFQLLHPMRPAAADVN